MLERIAEEISGKIGERDLVLDIGGWFRPFNRADWVVDMMPYESRGRAGHQGPSREFFSRETWVRRDLCSREPLPFPDRNFDFVVCSHTLEDLRDPLFVCSEMMRVGRRGYIEVPSIDSELSFGTETRHYAGHYHHRWLIDIADDGIEFMFKPHFIHSRWKYHLPASYGRGLTEERKVSWLYWEDGFRCEERVPGGHEEFLTHIESIVRGRGAYPQWAYRAEEVRTLLKGFRDGLRRTLSGGHDG